MATQNIRIAILGGRGMLGTDLARISRQEGFDPVVLDLPEFDITNTDHARQAVSSAEVIVNCAAYTNVDGAESEKDLAYAINAEAVGRLGTVVRDAGKYLLHISTDFVFDGRSDKPYVETDLAHPINTYGRSKLTGEGFLAESGCQHCIVRVEWTYGLAGNNFIKKLMQRAKAGNALKVVDDQVGSSTATTEVSKAICELLQKRPEGLFHFAAAGYVSRYDIAKFIVDKLSMDIDVIPCKTSDFPSPATRPLNSRFNCSKIQGLLSEPIEHWQKPLERFLGRL
jgi:dTDP-4-dehydrorhamnose reductase